MIQEKTDNAVADLSLLMVKNKEAQSEHMKELWKKLLENAKKDEFGPIDKVVTIEKADLTEGEAFSKAYSAKGQLTSYFTGEHYGKSTANVYYKSAGQKNKNDRHKTNAAEMMHSPVVENLIETQQAGVASQVYAKLKNEFGNVVTPHQDLY